MVDSGVAIRAQDDASAPSVGDPATPVAGTVAFDASYASSDHPPAPPDPTLALWNEGGSSQTRGAAVSPAYQPVPRVVVDVHATDRRSQPAIGARALDQIQAQMRSSGYWPFRRCFEAGLRDAPALEGETRFSLSVSARGRVLKVRVLDSKLSDRSVVTCLLNAAQKLKFTARPPRRIELIASIHLWPGDGPAPDPPEAATDADDAPFDASRTTSLIAHESTAISQCYEQALARDPTLWGRLALTVTLERDGTVHRIEEAESRFPDALVTRCAQAVIARLVFPPVLSKPFVFVQPIRFGAPPASPASDSDAGQNALLVSPPEVAR
ncbi:MAG TPA: AgmX/PglI C-terminal domain-containing protein [Polyangiaceae bacterium]|jgi:hypothetical protein